MSLTIALSWFAKPATILALVPLARFLIEYGFRRLFNGSTEEALALAMGDTRDGVANAVENETGRKHLATYVNNVTNLETFLETILFATLSLAVWNIFDARQGLFQWLSLALWVLIVVLVLWVAVSLFKRKIDFASVKSTKKYFLLAHVLDLAILLFEFGSKLLDSTLTGAKPV